MPFTYCKSHHNCIGEIRAIPIIVLMKNGEMHRFVLHSCKQHELLNSLCNGIYSCSPLRAEVGVHIEVLELKLGSMRTNITSNAFINMLDGTENELPPFLKRTFNMLFTIFCYHQRAIEKRTRALIYPDPNDSRNLFGQCPICYESDNIRLLTVD